MPVVRRRYILAAPARRSTHDRAAACRPLPEPVLRRNRRRRACRRRRLDASRASRAGAGAPGRPRRCRTHRRHCHLRRQPRGGAGGGGGRRHPAGARDPPSRGAGGGAGLRLRALRPGVRGGLSRRGGARHPRGDRHAPRQSGGRGAPLPRAHRAHRGVGHRHAAGAGGPRARFALRLARGEAMGPAEIEGYLGQGRRRVWDRGRPGYISARSTCCSTSCTAGPS